MTPEDLMKPRYKVIADYLFNSHFTVGEIVELNTLDTRKHLVSQDYYVMQPIHDSEGYTCFYESELDPYPHLFKKLEWWEERKESDMPEYVKDTTEDAVFKPFELKQQWGGRSGMWSVISPDDETDCHWKKNCVPATKEEYLNQTK